MKMGADIGNGYVKYGLGKKFLSSIDVVKTEEPYGEVHSVFYNGMDYTIGGTSKGQVIGDGKYKSKEYLILLLTAIALRNKGTKQTINANVVTGVPVRRYNKEFREEIKNFLGNRSEQIVVDGWAYDININKTEVMMEGSLPLKTNAKERVLVIDIGAGTVDVGVWENKRKIYAFTINQAFFNLAKDAAKFLSESNEFKMNVSTEQAYEYVGKRQVWCEGWKDTPELEAKMKDFVRAVATEIQNDPQVAYKSCKEIHLIGGGAIPTWTEFKENYFPSLEPLMDDAQFINQEIYEKCADVLFLNEE